MYVLFLFVYLGKGWQPFIWGRGVVNLPGEGVWSIYLGKGCGSFTWGKGVVPLSGEGL